MEPTCHAWIPHVNLIEFSLFFSLHLSSSFFIIQPPPTAPSPSGPRTMLVGGAGSLSCYRGAPSPCPLATRSCLSGTMCHAFPPLLPSPSSSDEPLHRVAPLLRLTSHCSSISPPHCCSAVLAAPPRITKAIFIVSQLFLREPSRLNWIS